MKNPIYIICKVLFIAGLYIILHSCKKDSVKADSFVDDYSPVLTEAAGTVHNENYFPCITGSYWTWSGNITATGTSEIVYNGQKDSEPINENNSVYGYMSISEPVTVSLPSGNYLVFPTNETNGLSRYFQVSDSAVLVRAIKNSGLSTIAEVKDPVYLRRPLKAGDKWKAQPTIDYNDLISNEGYNPSDFNLTINCGLFVVGTENVQLVNRMVSTVRLDERAEFNGTMNVNEDGATGRLSINMTMDIKLNLLKDTGIVSQLIKINAKVTGSISDANGKMSVNFNVNLNEVATLDEALFPVISQRESSLCEKQDIFSLGSNINSHPIVKKQLNKILDVIGKFKNTYRL
jgi:hypothetical protein